MTQSVILANLQTEIELDKVRCPQTTQCVVVHY